MVHQNLIYLELLIRCMSAESILWIVKVGQKLASILSGTILTKMEIHLLERLS